jgi:hypothetical protein
MRINIWAFGTTPETHQRLCRKKLSFVEKAILGGEMYPIDSSDLRKGVIVAKGVRLNPEDDHEKRAAGWGFDSAWGMRESGYAGPLVWQLRTV